MVKRKRENATRLAVIIDTTDWGAGAGTAATFELLKRELAGFVTFASGSTELAGFGLYCCGGRKLETISMTESALRDKDSTLLCHKIRGMELADLTSPARSAHTAAATVSATLSADDTDTVARIVLITPSTASLAPAPVPVAGDDDDEDAGGLADALDEVDEALVYSDAGEVADDAVGVTRITPSRTSHGQLFQKLLATLGVAQPTKLALKIGTEEVFVDAFPRLLSASSFAAPHAPAGLCSQQGSTTRIRRIGEPTGPATAVQYLTSVASMKREALCASVLYGQAWQIGFTTDTSVSDKDMAYHHTQYVALCEAMRAKDTAIVLQTDAGFSHFALVPSADGRVLLKAVASREMLLSGDHAYWTSADTATEIDEDAVDRITKSIETLVSKSASSSFSPLDLDAGMLAAASAQREKNHGKEKSRAQTSMAAVPRSGGGGQGINSRNSRSGGGSKRPGDGGGGSRGRSTAGGGARTKDLSTQINIAWPSDQ